MNFEKIVPTGLVPETAVETNWRGGLEGTPSAAKSLLLVGYPTADATAAAGERKRITSVADAIAYWGKGSILAVMAEGALDVAKRIPLYGASFAEGGAAVQASGTITLATTATGSGMVTVRIGGRVFRGGFAKDDTSTVVGDRLVALINAHPNLFATVANAGGVLTITARNGGPEGNSIEISCEITSGAGMTATASAARLSSGATPGDPTTTLAAVQPHRHHIIVLGTDDSTALGVLKAHQEAQSEPQEQLWGIGFTGHTGTRSAGETIVDALDSERMVIAHLKYSETPAFELGARAAADRATLKPNQSSNKREIRGVLPPRAASDWPNRAERQAGLEGGLSMIEVQPSGACRMERMITTVQTGAEVEAQRDITVIEISDYTDETILAYLNASYADRPLKVGSAAKQPDTVTPGKATDVLGRALMALDDLDYLQGVQAAIDAEEVFAEIDETDATQTNCAFPFWPVRTAHKTYVKKTYRRAA